MRRKALILFGVVLALLFFFIILNFNAKNVRDDELRVQEYFPKEEMIKEFSGGFENSGFTHTIDKIENGRAQVKQVDTGTGVIRIYEISENDISLIYSQEVGNGKFEENYIDTIKPNKSKIILKAPLKVGTKWTDDTGGKFEITGINVKVKTPVGIFYAIEVSFTRDDFEVKRYYVKGVGLVKSIIKEYGEDELIEIKYIKEK
ncbi:hypothetical protein [Vallitalea okinawensis]|uniref:hypothetical protein n=1 Tax=Vallitalea okinawensis TaxID=2078660 RepID=UPI000CFB8EDC|nr:hypothetical protein [Vallitalea okinawensis]